MRKQIEELHDADLDQVTGGTQLIGQTAGSQHLDDAVTGQAERSSSSLMLHCATGEHIKKATITC